MKKNTYRILIAAIILVILCIFLTGCRTEHQSEYEPRPETSQETTLTEQESLIGLRASYKMVITDTLKECKEKYPDEINHVRYGLYDFDNDSIPELFLEVYGSTTPDCYIHIYDYEGDKVFLVDSIQLAHSWVYITNKENAFLVEYSWMGESVWSIYELKNGELVSKKRASYYPDGFGDSIKPEENPLSGMGYEIKKIEYYEFYDLSEISSGGG